jgi:hypothetical protein
MLEGHLTIQTVHKRLNEIIPGWCIQTDLKPWLCPSLDFMLLHLYLFCIIKYVDYSIKINDIKYLKQKIWNSVGLFPDTLIQVWQAHEYWQLSGREKKMGAIWNFPSHTHKLEQFIFSFTLNLCLIIDCYWTANLENCTMILWPHCICLHSKNSKHSYS